MKTKYIWFGAIIVLLGAVILYFVNRIWGNPISGVKAKKEVESYFEVKYNKDFEVYNVKYNFLIPDYIIKLGPRDDPKAVFEITKYELSMFDPYGALLATKQLESKLVGIAGRHYPSVPLEIKAEEEHHIEIAGIDFDFFTPSAMERLEKNYFIVTVTIDNSGLTEDELAQIADGLADIFVKERGAMAKQLTLHVFAREGKAIVLERMYIENQPVPLSK